jgi:hypothetical protein
MAEAAERVMALYRRPLPCGLFLEDHTYGDWAPRALVMVQPIDKLVGTPGPVRKHVQKQPAAMSDSNNHTHLPRFAQNGPAIARHSPVRRQIHQRATDQLPANNRQADPGQRHSR